MSLFDDVGRALGQMGDPRFRGVLLKGVGVTLATLVALAWLLVAGLGWVMPDTVTLPWIGPVGFVDTLVSWAAIGALLLLSVVLMVPATAAAIGFFLDGIVDAVEARHYPELPPVEPMPVARQIREAAQFLALVIGVNLAALLVYVIAAPLAPVVFWLVNGFLLGREYFQMVAARRLGPRAARALRGRHAGRIWLTGVVIAVPLSVPVLNLVVPILGVAVFTHLFHRVGGPARQAA